MARLAITIKWDANNNKKRLLRYELLKYLKLVNLFSAFVYLNVCLNDLDLSTAFKLDVIEGRVVDDDTSLGFLECSDTTDASLVVAVIAEISPITLIVTCSRNKVAVGSGEFDAIF